MKIFRLGMVAALSITAALAGSAQKLAAESGKDLVRDALLQQSAAERAGCSGLHRSLAAGADAALVVRTAIELGFNSCQVLRCALEGNKESNPTVLCEKVIRGAAEAGTQADVITRCSGEVCDPAAVAAILANAFLEPNYCYFTFQPPPALEPLPPQLPVIDRSLPVAQASAYTF